LKSELEVIQGVFCGTSR